MYSMIREIEADVRATAHYIKRDKLDARVMDAMASVPRHEFVPVELQDEAYDNNPLLIGYGQTISQPYIVALMTDLLETRPNAIILEVGTGSGYQSAVLAELVAHVYSLEIIEPLAKSARQRLQQLGYSNVEVLCSDGYKGWPEQAPYDGIIVTAAAQEIPPP
jgi:protein-L-isoaspartate(D-aspartate) O-methyltransferase